MNYYFLISLCLTTYNLLKYKFIGKKNNKKYINILSLVHNYNENMIFQSYIKYLLFYDIVPNNKEQKPLIIAYGIIIYYSK